MRSLFLGVRCSTNDLGGPTLSSALLLLVSFIHTARCRMHETTISATQPTQFSFFSSFKQPRRSRDERKHKAAALEGACAIKEKEIRSSTCS